MYCSIINSGLPHSEILGSKFTYNSPRHIGVSPVLLRLLVPRHSPYALLHLTSLQYKNFNKLLQLNEYSCFHFIVDVISLIFLLLFSFQGTSKEEFASLKTELNNHVCFLLQSSSNA